MRTKKQFTEFRRAFKKWRAKWLPKVTAYSMRKDILFIYSDSDLLTQYIAPGYGKYMAYQFRKLKKKK